MNSDANNKIYTFSVKMLELPKIMKGTSKIDKLEKMGQRWIPDAV